MSQGTLFQEVTIPEILSMLIWTQPRRVETRNGPRLIQTAAITDMVRGVFWDSFKKHKAEWYQIGCGVSKIGTSWHVTRYSTMDGRVPETSIAMAAEAREDEAASYIPADWTDDAITLETEAAKLLLDYQIPAAKRLKRALMGLPPPEGYSSSFYYDPNGNALDASDTGTGKTFVALVVCAELGLKPCVIAPLAVLPSWQRAAKFLGISLGWLINYDKIRNGKSGFGRWRPKLPTPADPHAKGEFFEYTYLPGQKPVVIFDECQKCKSPDTKQGQIMRDTAAAGHKVLALSATAAKDPTEMRNLGAALGLHNGTHRAWEEWCKLNGCFSTNYGYKFDPKAKKYLEKLHKQIFPLRGQRMRVADIPTFPETSIMAEALDTGKSDDIADAYATMDRKLAEIAGMQKTNQEKAGMNLAAIMEARIASEKGKIDLFVELTKEALEEEKSVVLFLNFREHIAALSEKLKTDCLIWGTDMKGRQQKPDVRQWNIDAFQADRSRICIVSLQAGGAGLSLHDLNGNHPRLSLISPSYSANDLKQGLGRVHRAGAKTKSMQRIIFAAGTIEEEICKSIRQKLENMDTLNDGDLAGPSVLRTVKGADGELLYKEPVKKAKP